VRERAQLDATSATWLADQLEKTGLIERRRNDPDRRVVRIWLTPAGSALRDELEPEIVRWEAAIAAELGRHHTSEQLIVFHDVLRTLIVVLPEGDDLWATLSAAWDTALGALRDYLEVTGAERLDSKGS
jgi:DNA-binding MarR family transcriptional regulator